MWIKPNSQVLYVRNSTKEMEKVKKFIPGFNFRISKEKETEMDFEQLYRNDVFTSKKDLKILYNYKKIDVVIFTGYAGCGHYAPARALALEYAQKGKNVVLIDPLFIYSEFLAILNCWSWKMVSRHFNLLWLCIRKIFSTTSGSDFLLNFAKKIQSKEIYNIIQSRHVDIILSTYVYSNSVLSTYTKYVKFTGIVVPDLSPIGFLSEVYHNTKDIHFFLSDYNMYEIAKKSYPYVCENAGVHIMGNTPNCFTNMLKKSSKGNILLFSPGSGLGIGKGFNAIKTILDNWNGIIILLCGNNKKWLKKAKKYAKKYPNLIPFGYIDYDILKNFYEMSDVIVGKSGGSTVVELASMKGCKIIYSPILGQETENALKYSKLGCITYARNKEELVRFLKERPVTKSIYELEESEVSINSAKYVVDETLKNI